ncbi:MAG: methyl-accepting chemotaxis protein, partial [Kurthia sp.]
MKWTIGRKLGISFSIIMLVIVLMSAISIRSAFTLNSNTSTLNNEIIPEIGLLHTINAQTDRMFITMQKNLLSDDQPFKEKYSEESATIIQQIDESLKSYEVYAVSEQGNAGFATFKSKWTAVLEKNNEVIRLNNAGQADQASLAYYEVEPLYEEMQKSMNDLLVLLDQQSESIHNEGMTEFKRTVVLLLIGSLLALLLTISIVTFFIKAIKKPVELLSSHVQQLADGNLMIEPVTIKNQDEIGQLGTDFNSMLANLKGLIGGLQTHIQTVAATSEELSASAEETSKATDQITSAMVNVSEGADQQVMGARTSNEAISEMVTGMDHATSSVQSVFDLAVSTKEYTTVGATMMD